MFHLLSTFFNNRVLGITGVLFLVVSGQGYSQNAPVTIAPVIYAETGSSVDVPVRVTGFSAIGAVSLTLNFDTAVLAFQNSAFNPDFPGMSIQNASAGVVIIGGFSFSGDGITLADSTVLFTLTFLYKSGTSGLQWMDNGGSCEYVGASPLFLVLNDTPQSAFYLDGSVSGFPAPGAAGTITGPPGGLVCQGQSGVVFSVEAIPNATNYIWSIPAGATITAGLNTREITLEFSSVAVSGQLTVYGVNSYGNGAASLPYQLIVNDPPAILNQPVSPDTVIAGNGTAQFQVVAEGTGLSYQWQELKSVWTDITEGGYYSGSATDKLLISNPPMLLNDTRFRCVIQGVCDPLAVTDGTAMLTVMELLNSNGGLNPENEFSGITFQPDPCKLFTEAIVFLPERGKIEIEIVNLQGGIPESVPSSIGHKGLNKILIDTSRLIPGIYSITFLKKGDKAMGMQQGKLIVQ